MAMFWFCLLSFLNVNFLTTYSHPQCLDSQAPFVPNVRGQLWCRKYTKLGCCTTRHDAELKNLYENAIKSVEPSKQRKCKRFLAKVVCLKCHSWSAHIFDAEANPHYDKRASLPCLGFDFCRKFVEHCSAAIRQLYGEAMRARNITLRDFCWESEVALNMDLCFPMIKRTIGNLKNQKASNVAKGFEEAARKGCLCVREVVKGLRNPLTLVHARDETHRLFVVEQIGLVHIILANGTKLHRPFMDIKKKVLTSPRFGDERGFLGLAFHPKYRKNGRLFVYYSSAKKRDFKSKWRSARGEVTVLSEWKVSTNDYNSVDPNSEKVLLRIDQPKRNHNGGQLLFGDDGYLYVFPGDGGGAGDPFGKYGNSLNMSTLLGKVLRINIDNAKSYSIPSDNPFLRVPGARPEIFAYGVRNPWRCSVDRGERKGGYGKGRIFCGDVGQNKYEEIDIIVKGGNYGWRGREGFKCYDKKICKSSLMANEVLPIHAYSHKVGKSVVGGYVYRGCKYPNMRGLYFFADTMTSRIFQLKERRKDKTWHSKEVCMGDHSYCNGPGITGTFPGMILTFGEDESGELYFASTAFSGNASPKGAVYQLFDPKRRNDPSECAFTVKMPARKTVCKNRIPARYCNIYKRLGYCKKYYVNYMKRNCPVACGLC